MARHGPPWPAVAQKQRNKLKPAHIMQYLQAASKTVTSTKSRSRIAHTPSRDRIEALDSRGKDMGLTFKEAMIVPGDCLYDSAAMSMVDQFGAPCDMHSDGARLITSISLPHRYR